MNFSFDESQDEFNLSLYPSKCKKINQSEWRIRRREITTFARDLMRELSMESDRDIQKREKEQIKQNSKVSKVDIQLKRWGLRVSNTRVFNSGKTNYVKKN